MEARAETAENRLKRLRHRSWHRGIREMDLILGGFADTALAALPPSVLDAFEAILEENDHDLYAWVAGRGDPPPDAAEVLLRIRSHHGIG